MQTEVKLKHRSGLYMLEQANADRNGTITSLSPPLRNECEAMVEAAEHGLLECIEDGDGFFAPTYRITEKGRAYVKAHVPPAEW